MDVANFMELLQPTYNLSSDMECRLFREALVTVLARQHTISEKDRRVTTSACP